jgi:hypothetical protein
LPVLLAAACGGAPAVREPVPAPPVELSTPQLPPPPPSQGVGSRTIPGQLPNGMIVLVFPQIAEHPGRPAEIVFGYRGGAGTDRPGAAELAAWALMDLGDSAAGRMPLRQQISALGGVASVHLGPDETWLTLRVPQDRVEGALRALHATLEAPAPGRPQLERLRDDLVRLRRGELEAQPVQAVAGALLLGEDPAAYVASLEDRDPTEVVLFLARQCRPEHAVLALQAGRDFMAAERALALLAGWRPSESPGGATQASSAPGLRPGLYWARSDAAGCRAALILPLPEVADARASGIEVLRNCLSMDGVGGRLERMLTEAGLAGLRLRPRHVDRGGSSALLLELEATPQQVLHVWSTAERARQSLRDVPPSASELALATERARLTAYRDDASERGGLLPRVRRALRGESDLERHDRIAAPDPAGLLAATEALLASPMAMVVHGGEPPPGAGAGLVMLQLPWTEVGSRTAGVAAAIATEAAELEAATAAIGGRQRLQRLEGYRGVSAWRAPGAAPMQETLEWHRSGRLVRDLEVLSSRIETRIGPEQWIERLAGEQRELKPREAESLRRGAARHPLMLLGAWTRGEQAFRLVSVRRVHDRETAVLEALGDRFERLRLHVDRESHLVRTVESWETDPNGTPRHLQEHWSDYRTVSGHRVPFRRVTEVDDGTVRVETVWSSFTPLPTVP